MAAKKATKKTKPQVDTFDRAGFEAWAESEHYSVEIESGEGGWGRKGNYRENATQAAWEGWRAAKGYVAPKSTVNLSKLVVTVEHEEGGDGEWVNDMFTINFNGEKFAYGNLFLEEKRTPFNWSIFSTTDDVAKVVAKSIDFSALDDAKTPKQAIKLITKQVKAWIKTPQAKKVLEHFFKWKDNGTHATRLRG